MCVCVAADAASAIVIVVVALTSCSFSQNLSSSHSQCLFYFSACGTRIRVRHSCTQLLLAVFYKLELFRCLFFRFVLFGCCKCFFFLFYLFARAIERSRSAVHITKRILYIFDRFIEMQMVKRYFVVVVVVILLYVC